MKFLMIIFLSTTSAFVTPPSTTTSTTSLFGISEWRDTTTTSTENTIGVMPMASKDVLLQGQTKYVQFVEEHEIQLVQQAMKNHEGMMGMGLKMFGEGVLPTMPLLEIEDYVTTEDFGTFCQVRAVGRVKIDQQPEEPTAPTSCREVFDEDDDALYMQANEMADEIETLIADMSVIERMIGGEDRLARFQEAYQTAMEYDNQGYVSSSSFPRRSWKELSTIAWASYSTSSAPDKDATFRLNAMNMQSVVERLELAQTWLNDVLQEVEQEISQSP